MGLAVFLVTDVIVSIDTELNILGFVVIYPPAFYCLISIDID